MDLETNVIFLGDVRKELKNTLLEAADIFLMPSIEDKASVEGFGISFLEASCFKTPSIGGLVGGWLFGAVGISILDGWMGDLLEGVIGAVVIMAIAGAIKKK